ncbi:hypothetical protein TNCV_3151701 [Trichonephila clavipes]|nr:hypothetical protein TNCV_3151701 [Trichonephila clavipes]
MDVCKCIVPSWHVGTVSRRKSSRELVQGMEGMRPLTLPQGVLSLNWGETALNRSVICMVLKDTSNDRRTSSPLP